MPDRTRRFVEIPEPDNTLALTLKQVVDTHLSGDPPAAKAALQPIWGWTKATHPVEQMPELPGAEKWPKSTGAKTRPIPMRTKAAVYEGGSYTCVYCARLTVHPNVLRLLHRRFPQALPFAPNGHWAGQLTHPVWWDISTTVDHVTAAAMGGDDAEANLVCACWRCQWQKVHRPLDALGWPTRMLRSRWRGLTEHYDELWRIAGRPKGQDAAWRAVLSIARTQAADA